MKNQVKDIKEGTAVFEYSSNFSFILKNNQNIKVTITFPTKATEKFHFISVLSKLKIKIKQTTGDSKKPNLRMNLLIFFCFNKMAYF